VTDVAQQDVVRGRKLDRQTCSRVTAPPATSVWPNWCNGRTPPSKAEDRFDSGRAFVYTERRLQ